MAKKKRARHQDSAFEQDSHFLRLPGEIRTLIYRIALVKPEAIDLCPFSPIEDPTQLPGLVQRMEAEGMTTLCFRDQHDLRYVRQQLAPGLLGACRQIRMEAMSIFWAENLFRFSTDFDWFGLRRFLTTIGKDARAHITRLEVALPLFSCPLSRIDGAHHAYQRKPMKNHPKLHMAKVYSSRPSNLFQIDTYQHFDFVQNMLHEERVLQQLTLVIPKDWRTDYLNLIQLRRFETLRFIDLSVVVEPGAQLSGNQEVEQFTTQGVRVVACPASLIAPQYPSSQQNPPTVGPKEVLEKQEWLPPTEGVDDFLPGVERLFDESECVRASAIGKSRTRRASLPAARVLRGFGGCRFVIRKGMFCNQCNQEIKFNPKSAEHWKLHESWCVRCKFKGGFRHINGIEVRKLTRVGKQEVNVDE